MGHHFKHVETKLIHAGEPRPRIHGAVAIPVFQSATFEYSGESSYHDIKYIRLNNTPNHVAINSKLAALENAEDAMVTASGMAAISTALLSVLKQGDHFLAQECLYGGTFDFVAKDLPELGITFDFIDGNDPGSWESKLKPNTKAMYVESMANPLLEVPHLKEAAEFAKAHDLVSLIDNTFASPVNFRPAEWGYDLSLHSCTKYLNGHSDIVAGAVIGRAHLVELITHKLNHLGGTLDPHTCFLLHRGVKTLALRMRQHNRSALEIAAFLESHPAVSKVNYPGLESHPAHQIAAEMFDGFSGMLSFELSGGVEAAETFFERATLPVVAPSLGGIETLLTRPATTSHSGLSAEEREEMGISEGLVRVSVGIENTDDLIADFEQALET